MTVSMQQIPDWFICVEIRAARWYTNVVYNILTIKTL